MEQKKNRFLHPFLILLASSFLLLIVILNEKELNAWLEAVSALLRPVLIGLILAYFANPIFRFFERKVLFQVKPSSLRRFFSLLLTYIVICAILFVLVMLIIPQLFESIGGFALNYESYLNTAVDGINRLIFQINTTLPENTAGTGHIPYLKLDEIIKAFNELIASMDLSMDKIASYFSPETIGSFFTLAGGIIDLFGDTVIGIFISVYLLHQKEKFYAQVMRLRRAVLPEGFNAALTRVLTTADRSFGSFIKGKLVDSSIVGLLVYIALSILHVPNALLIAVIVGITDIVPIIGPFVGVIPSAVIILLTEPSKLIPFLICILIIQQIDGNIIAPKILGENTGVSSLCVMIAITVMGAIWGLVGMVIGVPLFATVGELFSSYLDKRLEKRGLPSGNAYYAEDANIEESKSEKLFVRLQKKIRRIRSNTADGGHGDLTDSEKDLLEIYAAAKRHHVFLEDNEENLAHFAADRASHIARTNGSKKPTREDTDSHTTQE